MSQFSIVAFWLLSSYEQTEFLPRISVGTGIFLGSLLISLVWLYGQTKDRWDWAMPVQILIWLFRWIGRTLLRIGPLYRNKRIQSATALMVISGLTFWGMHAWNKRQSKIDGRENNISEKDTDSLPDPPKSLPYKWTYSDFYIGLSKEDMTVERGLPAETSLDYFSDEIVHFSGLERVLYPSSRSRLGVLEAHHTIYLKDSFIVAIRFRVGQFPVSWWRNCGLKDITPVKDGDLIEKFGHPTLVVTSPDATSRDYFFDDFGFMGRIRQGSLSEIAIYDPMKLPARKTDQ